MDYIGVKFKGFLVYLKIPIYNKKNISFYEFIICTLGVFIGINWAWHTGTGLYIDTKWFFLKWAWRGIADDYSRSKSKFQFVKKGKK